jgi:transglutaminase-like putative cysteine protease
MLYRITHTTRFEYDEPAYDSQNELHMRPWDRDGQRCLEFELTADQPASIFAFEDFFGNRTHSLSVSPVHEKLAIVARSMVELTPPPTPGNCGVTFADFLRDDPIRNNIYFEYLNESRFIPFSERLRKFFWMARPEDDEDVTAYVTRMAAYVRDQFEYETSKTHVHSSINDILKSGGGVCQDFAHLTIGILRLAGIPARYVSGYLAPGTGSPAAIDVTAQASHAWLEAWIPGMGWSGFDPTHRCATDGRHIGVAAGRDYGDVPPLRGVFRSDGTTSAMSVDLSVERADGGESQGGPAVSQTQQ